MFSEFEGSFLPCGLADSGITAEQHWGENVVAVTEHTHTHTHFLSILMHVRKGITVQPIRCKHLKISFNRAKTSNISKSPSTELHY